MNGSVVPKGIINLEKQFQQAEKEVDNLQKKYDEAVENQSVVFSTDSEKEDPTIKLADDLERAIDKAEELRRSLESAKININSSEEVVQLTKQLDLMNSKLSQTKEESNQTRASIIQAFKDRTKDTIKGISKVGSTTAKVGLKVSSFGIKLASAFASKTVGKGITNISNKLGTLKNKLSRLISGAAFFSLFNGGFERLRNTISSVLKVDTQFNSNLNKLKTNLMTAFAPIYNAVLPALNSLMSALTQVTGTIAQFVSSLFGQSLKDSTKQAKKLSNALDDTAKSGKNASGQLASFDKLEVIGGNESSDKNNNAIDYSEPITVNSQLLEIFNKIKGLFTSGDWGGLAQLISEGFVSGLLFIKEKIKSIDWSEIGKGISDFLNNIDYSGILTGIISIFGESILGFQELLFNIDFKELSKKISKAIKDSFNKISEYIGKIDFAQLGQKLSEAITNFDWEGTGRTIIDTLWSSLKGISTFLANINWGDVGKTLSNTVNGLIDEIIKLFSETNWGEIGKTIVDGIWDFITNIDWLELAKNILLSIATGVKSLNDLITGAFKELILKILEVFGISGDSPSTAFSDVGKKVITGLQNGINSIKQKIIDLFSNIFSQVKTKVEEKVNGIVSFIKGLPQKIATGLSSIPEKFKQAFQKAFDKVKEIWNKITSLFSKGGKIFSGLKDGIASAFKSIVNTLIEGINKVISTPFDKINKLLNDIRNVNILGIKPFEKLWSQNPLPIPKIPKLAKGTVIPPRQEFMAILGDQKHGTNIEAPLETIKQANREVLDERERNMSSDNRTIVIERLEVPLECDKRELGRASYKGLKLLEIETGKFILVS